MSARDYPQYSGYCIKINFVCLLIFFERTTGILQQAEEDQLKALDGRRKIKGMYETRWSSRADALNTFKSAHALIVDTLNDLAIEMPASS
jgi:hypothetical protein